jgi:hypothetical protein
MVRVGSWSTASFTRGFLVPSAGAPPRDQTAANHQKQDENAQCSAEAGESDECHKTE